MSLLVGQKHLMTGKHLLSTFETDVREVWLAKKWLEGEGSHVSTFHASRAGDHLAWDLDQSLQGQTRGISHCVEVIADAVDVIIRIDWPIEASHLFSSKVPTFIPRTVLDHSSSFLSPNLRRTSSEVIDLTSQLVMLYPLASLAHLQRSSQLQLLQIFFFFVCISDAELNAKVAGDRNYCPAHIELSLICGWNQNLKVVFLMRRKKVRLRVGILKLGESISPDPWSSHRWSSRRWRWHPQERKTPPRWKPCPARTDNAQTRSSSTGGSDLLYLPGFTTANRCHAHNGGRRSSLPLIIYIPTL